MSIAPITIHHITAVLLPPVLGVVWLSSSAVMFLCGTAFAVTSLLLSLKVPEATEPGNEVVIDRFKTTPATPLNLAALVRGLPIVR